MLQICYIVCFISGRGGVSNLPQLQFNIVKLEADPFFFHFLCQNRLSYTTSMSKPHKSFTNRKPGDYAVENFQKFKTSFGDSVRIELSDCIMYLPERFASIVTDESIKRLNNLSVIMTYSGKDPKVFSIQLQRNMRIASIICWLYLYI